MTALCLDAIRDCLDGAVPGVIATCAPDGTPNVSYVSQIHYLDRRHVALSFQFFNKTHRNVRANPHVRLLVRHPVTATRYGMDAEYLRTETSGALFEHMRAKLAGIAAHAKMADVFRLLGADVYRVDDIRLEHGDALVPLPPRNPLAALRAISSCVARQDDLDAILDAVLDGLTHGFDVEHAMVLLFDPARERLFVVGSRGYATSGAGAEVALGAGVIGIAARERTPIRLTHLAAESAYARASGACSASARAEREIPFVGLSAPESQLAVPILSGGALRGVLFVESEHERRFGYDDEDALIALSAQLGAAIAEGPFDEVAPEPEEPFRPSAPPRGTPAQVRHYPEDDSVFVDGEYLIKGVAGAILWRMLSDHAAEGREEFTNRELRRDPRLGLPGLSDNLEARLVLLTRRLRDRTESWLRIEKTGRGRMRLVVERPVELSQVG